MIRSIPMIDQQGNTVNVGDVIVYITHQYGDTYMHYAKVIKYAKIPGPFSGPVYAMHVEALNTDLEYARRILTNPTVFKCGVELAIPTDTQIKGMQI